MLTGVADLPLHDGSVPPRLYRWMVRLASAILEVLVEEFGPGEVVRRLGDPYWFQALNNAIGMDWDSSGSTTVLTAVLRDVSTAKPHLGIAVAGGKGVAARRTPEELERAAERLGLGEEWLGRVKLASKLAAKTDSALLQDGYQLYHHAVVAAADGSWCIIQQGMKVEARMARRYHWLPPLPREATLEPHSAIVAATRSSWVIDLTSRRSLEARRAVVELASEGPRVLEELRRAVAAAMGVQPLTTWLSCTHSEWKSRAMHLVKYYKPPRRPHKLHIMVLRRLREEPPSSMEELLLREGVGPSLLRSLALVAELVYGYEVSHDDPATLDPFKFAYVVGGKDGIPYPYDTEAARRVVEVLEDAVNRARLSDREKLRAIARLRKLLVVRRASP